MLSIIVVIGKNREIGCDNKLLWDIPLDMKRFTKITKGHPVLMGDKTFESIGAALPERTNIIITRDKNYQAEGCEICHSIEDAIKLGEKQDKNEIFIIGGGSIYKQTIDIADKLYLTVVDDSPEADTYFPDYSQFQNTIYEENIEDNGLNFTFLELTK